MTNNEAIRTLKANYPDACFEQLREAVDVAINALTALPEKTQLSEEDATSDCISRKAAIDALMPIYKSASLRNRNVFSTARKCMSAIEDLPSAQPDMSEYSDKLWKKAYERGRAEAQDEIVRCKECKHGSPNGKYGCRVYHYRRYETHDMKPDDFCSRAERRTDDR